MPVQSTYKEELDAAFEGQKRDLSLTNIISRKAEATDIAFGRAVVRGTADDQALLPSSIEDQFIGVTVETTAWSENADALHLYSEYREANIINYGELWIYTETAVVPGDPVFYRFAAETAPLDIVGRFRNDSSGGNALKIEGATFETTTAAGELAVVKLTSIETALQEFEIATSADDAGFASLFTTTTLLDSSGGAFGFNLGDAVLEGQTKIIKMIADSGDVLFTPTNLFDGNTLTFDDVNDCVVLRFINGEWTIILNNGAVLA